MLGRVGRDTADAAMNHSAATTADGKEGGHSFLTDPVVTVTNQRWGNGNRLRALRKAGGKLLDLDYMSGSSSGSHSSSYDKPDLSHLEEPLRRLSFTPNDLMQVAEDREQFDAFKKELRQKGAITNSMLKQNLHLYVQNQLELRRAFSESPLNTIPPLTPPSSNSSASSSGSSAADNRRRTFSFGST